MPHVPITEALQQLKILKSRIDSQFRLVAEHAALAGSMRDPFEKSGGSANRVKGLLASIEQLQQNLLAVRAAIAQANQTATVSIRDTTMTVANWLVWRREVLPSERAGLEAIQASIAKQRARAAQQPVVKNLDGTVTQAADVQVFVDETAVVAKLDKLHEIERLFDAKLSVHNATTMVEFQLSCPPRRFEEIEAYPYNLLSRSPTAQPERFNLQP